MHHGILLRDILDSSVLTSSQSETKVNCGDDDKELGWKLC